MTEKYLPNATTERLENPGYEDDYQHGVDCAEFEADSALKLANSKVIQLNAYPLTAYVLTHDLQTFMVELAHWLSKGYFIGDSSALACREDLQSAQLFKPLF